MLVDADLNDVPPPYVRTVLYKHADPDNPDLDEHGNPVVEHEVQFGRSIERLFSAEELAEIGLWRLNFDPIRADHRQVEARTFTREWRGNPQTAWHTWDTEPIPATRDAVTQELNRRLVAIAVVEMDDGRSIPVDTRDDTDLIRITAVYNNAGRMKSLGRSDPITWVGADNAEYELDIDQQIEMPAKVFAHQQALIRASHAVKAQVEAGTLTNAADIPAAFDAILSPAP